MRLGDGGTEVGLSRYIGGIGFYQSFFSEPVLASLRSEPQNILNSAKCDFVSDIYCGFRTVSNHYLYHYYYHCHHHYCLLYLPSPLCQGTPLI